MVSNNIPQVKLGIIAVSRDCFPIALSTQRRENLSLIHIYVGVNPLATTLDWVSKAEGKGYAQLLEEHYNQGYCLPCNRYRQK